MRIILNLAARSVPNPLCVNIPPPILLPKLRASTVSAEGAELGGAASI